MRPLKISHSAVTSKALLRMADSIPGAWIGIRIAGLLLLLSGWKSTTVSRLFGLSRQAVVDWIGKANRQGLDSIYDVARSGRPTRLDRVAQDKLEKALAKSPEEYGLQRSRWDGVVVRARVGVNVQQDHCRLCDSHIHAADRRIYGVSSRSGHC